MTYYSFITFRARGSARAPPAPSGASDARGGTRERDHNSVRCVLHSVACVGCRFSGRLLVTIRVRMASDLRVRVYSGLPYSSVLFCTLRYSRITEPLVVVPLVVLLPTSHTRDSLVPRGERLTSGKPVYRCLVTTCTVTQYCVGVSCAKIFFALMVTTRLRRRAPWPRWITS
jgi:hypothetical protein